MAFAFVLITFFRLRNIRWEYFEQSSKLAESFFFFRFGMRIFEAGDTSYYLFVKFLKFSGEKHIFRFDLQNYWILQNSNFKFFLT